MIAYNIQMMGIQAIAMGSWDVQVYIVPSFGVLKMASMSGSAAQLPFALPKLRRFLGAPYVPMKRSAVEVLRGGGSRVYGFRV